VKLHVYVFQYKVCSARKAEELILHKISKLALAGKGMQLTGSICEVKSNDQNVSVFEAHENA
jgi:hypothetical protein